MEYPIRIMRKYLLPFTLLFTLTFTTCQQESNPKLVVFIALDHFAQYTYEHYAPEFTGGFKWLHDNGVTFAKTSHLNGYTSTGPGHFVLGSGVHPGPAGVLGNHWYDRIKGHDVYCIDDPDAKSVGVEINSGSYDKINANTFGDWLKAASPESKVYSVSCKDRAAVMLGGKDPDLALWWNWSGAFGTTDYYADTIPGWVYDFNEQSNFLSYRDSLWERSRPMELYDEYTHGDDFQGEEDRYQDSVYSPVMPIGFETSWDDRKVLSRLAGYPWMDRITLELASRTIDEAGLGTDDHPDVLAVGLSVMDLVSHYYGPFSHEVMDHLLRVDDYLQDFLDRLDQQVGLENVVIALTSDHGGLPLPEHWTKVQGKVGGRVDGAQYKSARENAYAEIDSLYGSHDFILRKGSSYYFDQAIMDSMQVDKTVVVGILQRHVESVDGIHRLYTREELLSADGSDYRTTRLKNFMHPSLSPDIYTVLDYGWLFRQPLGTNHSTPYDYDSDVVFILASEGRTAKTVTDPVATIDIPATLSEIMGVKAPAHIDGKSLISYLQP